MSIELRSVFDACYAASLVRLQRRLTAERKAPVKTIDPVYMKRARIMVENMEHRQMDRAQALVIALAKSPELTHRVRQLEKSYGMDLPDGTKIRANSPTCAAAIC